MTKLRFLAVATAARLFPKCWLVLFLLLFLLLCLRYLCVIHALFLLLALFFLRCSCVILALYSCVILALFLRYPAAILALFFWLFPRHRPPLTFAWFALVTTH